MIASPQGEAFREGEIMNKYENLIEYTLSLYPDEIDISDGELRTDTGFYSKNLSDAWHGAEDINEDGREDVDFMTWSIYGVLHRKCREDFRKGIYKIKLSDLSIETIIKVHKEKWMDTFSAEVNDAKADFAIDVSDMGWIRDEDDDPYDLCAHGCVAAKIGNEIFCDYATVSSTAIYLLKTLTENHAVGEENQMIPCCGHTMIASENCDMVHILGCDYGTDWAVEHVGDTIKLTTEKGNETIIPIEEYRKVVFSFADKVEAFYKSCSEKNLPDDEFERNGYIALWNEWQRRRHAEKIDRI